MAAEVTFIEQMAPIDEYGRALYAVCRSILRALLDSLTTQDLTILNTPTADVTMRQLAMMARLDRDKGMRGDGFEWAVHEAIAGREPKVLEPISTALRRASKYVQDREPNSLLFGHERARYLGFLDAVIDEAGTDAFLLPDRQGRPFKFGPWVAKAAQGHTAESELHERIKKYGKQIYFYQLKVIFDILQLLLNRISSNLKVGAAFALALSQRMPSTIIEQG
jgi:hypothetical protein